MDDVPSATQPDHREMMAAEGKRLVDAARARGLTIRLIGGLAVRDHCEVLDFCARDYSDLDAVAHTRSIVDLVDFFSDHGYRENVHVRQATGGEQAQFVRPCRHRDGRGTSLHDDDHIDVFLDTFVMDHRIELKRRLELEPYTVSLSDVLLTKLQIHEHDARDLRDVVTILKDRPMGDTDAPGVVNVTYIAALCADDWGLSYDVIRSLDAAARLLPGLELSGDELATAEAAVRRLREAIEQAPKTRRWRRRARTGTRRPWHNEVEERDGSHL